MLFSKTLYRHSASLQPGARFSKVPGTFRARKAIAQCAQTLRLQTITDVFYLRTIFASSASSAGAHERVHVQNVRDFPETKLDNGINRPFLLNEHGDPRFFIQVFAKNSLMKDIFEEENKFDCRT